MQLHHVLVLGREEAEMGRGLHDAGAGLDVALGFFFREVFEEFAVWHDDDGEAVFELRVEGFAFAERLQLGLGQGGQGGGFQVARCGFPAVVDVSHVFEEVLDLGADVAGFGKVGDDGCGCG